METGAVEKDLFDPKVFFDGELGVSLFLRGAYSGEISSRILETVPTKFPTSSSVALLVSRKFACVSGRLSAWHVEEGFCEPVGGER